MAASDTPLAQLIDLSGRAAIVTGAAQGIGLGIARRLAEAGASVLLADVDAAGAEAAAAELSGRGARTRARRTDVASEEEVEAMVAACGEAFGRIDILVNNAGIFPNQPIEAMSAADFDRVLAVNLRGVFLATRAAAAAMRQAGGGTIINVTSIDALHPSMVGLAHYDASKHGAWGFTKNAALELAPHGIRVNAIAPGGVLTPGVEALQGAGAPAGGADPAALVQAFLAAIPMRRFADPDEIGRAAVFLASDLASYMTGAQVVVDGGALVA
jgi:2-dehydro-3-deoxy-D-gluconate 5-dehydrogenase